MKSQPVIVTAIFAEDFKTKVEYYCEINGISHQQFFTAALSLGASVLLQIEIDELRHLVPSLN